MFKKYVIVLIGLMYSMVTLADEVQAEVKSLPVTPRVSATPDILSVVLALMAVVGVILLLAYVVKRLNPAMLQKNTHLKILAMQSLGPRERMVLVAVGDQQLLLGVTQHQVTLLHTLSEPLVSPEVGQPSFATQLHDMMARRG